MSAVLELPNPAPALSATRPAGRTGLRQAIAAEWTKLWSVRSTMWTLIATGVAVVGLGVLSTATLSHNEIVGDPTRRSLIGIFLGQLIFGVLGVLVMSAEYGTGTIRSTLSAVPRRTTVLTAKFLVFGGVAVVVSEALSFAAFGVGQAILSAKHALGTAEILQQVQGGHVHQAIHKLPAGISSLIATGSASLGQPGVLRAVIGAGLYLAVLGLLALGLATIVRHTAGAIAAFVGVVLVLPLIVEALPQSLSDAVSRYLPANVGMVLFSTNGAPDRVYAAFSPWAGFGLLVLYTAVVAVCAGAVLTRRDA
ncbi:MAG TPA: ABC transporter permease subunit [Acidimicrobiales bacterium]|nr:ABC transporter permease subunit [Acidimicrobiales bacterium]